MADKGVGLADAIEALRSDLEEALDKGKNKRLRFTLSPIELTLQVSVDKEANAKVGWHVVGLGGSIDSAHAQTLKLTLTPGLQQEDGTVLPASQWTIAGQHETEPKFGPRPPR